MISKRTKLVISVDFSVPHGYQKFKPVYRKRLYSNNFFKRKIQKLEEIRDLCVAEHNEVYKLFLSKQQDLNEFLNNIIDKKVEDQGCI